MLKATLPTCVVIWRCLELHTTTTQGSPLLITNGYLHTAPLAFRCDDPGAFCTISQCFHSDVTTQCCYHSLLHFPVNHRKVSPCLRLCFWELECRAPDQMDMVATIQISNREDLSAGSAMSQRQGTGEQMVEEEPTALDGR